MFLRFFSNPTDTAAPPSTRPTLLYQAEPLSRGVTSAMGWLPNGLLLTVNWEISPLQGGQADLIDPVKKQIIATVKNIPDNFGDAQLAVLSNNRAIISSPRLS